MNVKKDIKKKMIKRIFEGTCTLFIFIVCMELLVIFVITMYFQHIPLMISSISKNELALTLQYIKKMSIAFGMVQIVRYGFQYPILSKLYQKINDNGKNISYDFFSKAKMNQIDNEDYLKVNLITENINNTIFNSHVFFKEKAQMMIFAIYALLKNTPKIGFIYIIYMCLLYQLGKKLIYNVYISGEKVATTRTESKEFTSDLNRNFFLHKLFDLNLLNKNFFNKYIKKENEALSKNMQAVRIFLVIVNGINLFNMLGLAWIVSVINLPLVVKGQLAFAILSGLFNLNGVVMYVPAFTNEISRISDALKLFDLPLEEEKKKLNIDIVEDIKISHINYIYKEKHNLSKHISKEVFNNFSHEFKKGINIIEGPSGCGKSTLLKIMIGLYDIQSGDVIINNNYSVKEYNFLPKITYITQLDLIFNRTVKENLLLKNEENQVYENYINNTKIKDIVNKSVGISGGLISGGECKRVVIGRSLMSYKEGNVVIFDEPFVGLDDRLISEVIKIIINFKKNIIIVIDHTKSLEKYLNNNKIFFHSLKLS